MNLKMNYKEHEMKSQLNKPVTSDVARDAVMRSRQDRRDSMVFDRGKTSWRESWNWKGVRIRKGKERSFDRFETSSGKEYPWNQ